MKAKLSDAELAKELESLNAKRENFSTFSDLLFVLMFLNLAAMGFVAFVMPWYINPFLLSFGIGTIITIPVASIEPIFSNKMKMLLSNMIEDTLKKNFELIEYNHDSHISEAMVRETKFFNIKRIYGSDLIRANYKGVGFEFSDIWFYREKKHQVKVNESGDKGQWLVIRMTKEINPPVTVSELAGLSFLKGNQTMVKMENMAFNKQFMVFTEDPQKAFYVLTPHFMEFIMSLKQLTDSKLHLCFAGFHAYIVACTGRNSFYPYDKDGYGLNLLRNKMQREVDFIKRVIDGFLQNERLFGLSRTA
jgi:hypothetical protein